VNAAQPLVSVIIPVYNGARFLPAALESVFAQTYAPMEILVIDDGSCDGSARVAAGFPDVRVVSQPHRGVSAARNRGLALATGTYIAFLDADDLWKPGKTRRQMEVMRRPAGPEMLCARFRNFVEPGVTLPTDIPIQAFLREETGRMLWLGTLLARKSRMEAIGEFNPALPHGEDLDWFARARDAGVDIPVLPEVLAERRLHDRNLTYSARQDRTHLINIFRQSIHRKNQPGKEHES